MNGPRKIHFVAAQIEEAAAAMSALQDTYGQYELDDADVIVALGGDGFMLRTLHRFLPADLPVYGMKLGNVGFLMNRFREDGLHERLNEADVVGLNPLSMIAVTEAGNESRALAINEVSLLRQVNQAAHIRILINGSVKVEELVCDGVLVSTAAGSSAYNLSVQGPILPLGSDALALTPISPFRPRRWRGAVLPSSVHIRFEVLDNYKRPVSATADAEEIRNVISVDVYEEKEVTLKMMFDPDHSLEQRILDEQFL
ncbi:MAG: NAD kinase [Xanthomonadales bacterium]|nr:NAD kinase [Xanthomonadales bacterium]MDH3923573.1 NAD kinase [Xanthomonadales bacterium]MDH3939956.1 NAD kinase [Xanthomonadales bacterium]MDH3999933.1 NAD kinase [Xanthomonadales bacterium]